MFNFLDMMGNYEQRVVGRYDEDENGLFVSTAEVCDGQKPFETAVDHPAYGDGMIIVENYYTKEEAQIGHTRSVERMTAENLPSVLEDCNNSFIQQLCSALDVDNIREKGKL